MRLLGKRRSSDSAVRVIALAIPCIIELLARPGPAHQGTVVCLCPRDHETHYNEKASVTVSVEEKNTVFDIHSTAPRPSVRRPGSIWSHLWQLVVHEETICCATSCSARLIKK